MSDRRLREAAFFDAAVGPVKDAPVDRFISDLLSNIPADLSGARVLDLGCGIGELSRLLADRGARVTGVDVSSEALAQATSDTRCGFALAAAEQLPFPDSSFDLVVGSLILHHLPIERTAQELRRILRSEGRACSARTSDSIQSCAWRAVTSPDDWAFRSWAPTTRNRLTGQICLASGSSFVSGCPIPTSCSSTCSTDSSLATAAPQSTSSVSGSTAGSTAAFQRSGHIPTAAP